MDIEPRTTPTQQDLHDSLIELNPVSFDQRRAEQIARSIKEAHYRYELAYIAVHTRKQELLDLADAYGVRTLVDALLAEDQS